jgi:HEAT repeat protein
MKKKLEIVLKFNGAGLLCFFVMFLLSSTTQATTSKPTSASTTHQKTASGITSSTQPASAQPVLRSSAKKPTSQPAAHKATARKPVPPPVTAKDIPRLTAQYRKRDRYKRLTAIRQLADLAPRERSIVPVLLKALGDPYNRIVMVAGDALRKYGLWIVPKLQPLLQEPRRRLYAIGVICNIGPQALPLLRKMYRKVNWRERLWIVQFMPRMFPQSIPFLLHALQDRNTLVRYEALILLGRLKKPAKSVQQAILNRLGDTKKSIRYSAIDILFKHNLKSQTFLARLLMLGALGNIVDKIKVLRYLRKFRKKAHMALPWVRLMSSQKNDVLRKEAFATLMGWKHWLNPRQLALYKRLEFHSDWKQRQAAAKTLESLGSKETLLHYFLQRSLQDRFMVRVYVMRALQKIGSQATSSLLLFLRQDRHWVLRQDAALILGRWGSKARVATSSLRWSAQQDRDKRVRAAALKAFAQVAPTTTSSGSFWNKAMQDREISVRIAAIRACGIWAKRQKAIPPALSKASRDSNPLIRGAALEVLKKLSSL